MGRNQAQRQGTVRSSVKGAPAHRAPRRPRPGRAFSERPRPKRAARRRKAVGAGERDRRRLFFYVLVASVAAQIAAAFAGSGALLALLTLLGLLLSGLVIHS
jgi:hypothetical protein